MVSPKCVSSTEYWSLTQLDRASEAEDLLERTAALIGDGPTRLTHIWAWGSLALARLRRGDAPGAADAATHALEWIQRTPAVNLILLDGYSHTALVYLALWEAAGARRSEASIRVAKQTRQAIQALGRYTVFSRIGQPTACRYRGRLAWLEGQAPPARWAWVQSLRTAQQLQMPYEWGLAHYELGRHTDGVARRRHLVTAGAMVGRLGATYDIAQVNRAFDSQQPVGEKLASSS